MMKEIERPTTLEQQYLESMQFMSIENTFKSITGFDVGTFLKLYEHGIIQVDNYELIRNMISTNGLTSTINFFQRFTSKIFTPIIDKPKKSLIRRVFDFCRGIIIEDYVPY